MQTAPPFDSTRWRLNGLPPVGSQSSGLGISRISSIRQPSNRGIGIQRTGETSGRLGVSRGGALAASGRSGGIGIQRSGVLTGSSAFRPLEESSTLRRAGLGAAPRSSDEGRGSLRAVMSQGERFDGVF